MRPEHQETMSLTPLRDRMRGMDDGPSVPTELPIAYVREVADLTARSRRGERTPDAVLCPYHRQPTGQPAVYVWRAHSVRRPTSARRLGTSRPEGAA